MKDASLAKRTCVVIAMTDAIPAPPAVAMRLFQATSSARTSVDEVVAILAADPAMAARVVSLCRRCNRGVSGDVDTLERTVILLGFEEIRAAAISVEICGVLGADSSSDFLVGLRRHAVLTASIARVAAERIPGLGDLEPSTGFLAGLLHDLGHLVLATAIPGPLERLAESATLLDAEFNDTLLRVIGIDGSMIGERIARRWDLPGFLHAVVTSAGRGPAAIGDTEHRRLELLVGFADAIARRCSPDSIGRRPGVGTIREYEAALGLDKVDLKTPSRWRRLPLPCSGLRKGHSPKCASSGSAKQGLGAIHVKKDSVRLNTCRRLVHTRLPKRHGSSLAWQSPTLESKLKLRCWNQPAESIRKH